MTVEIIKVTDLTPFMPQLGDAALQALIDDAMSDVAIYAPCLLTVDETGKPVAPAAKLAKAKAILRRAILRADEAGFGTRSSESISFDGISHSQGMQVTGSRTLLFPHEKDELGALCAQPATRRAGVIDMFDATLTSTAVIPSAGI